jgi:serine/threonine protein kinase
LPDAQNLHSVNEDSEVLPPLDALLPEFAQTLQPELKPGDFLGPYRLIRQLGSGGMGVVYEAVREDGEISLRVAVKVLHSQLCTPDFLSQMRQEASKLAKLRHTDIASLLDWKLDQDDIPYFVLEYVEGQPITCCCESNALSREACLRLFIDVCKPVSFAHRNWIAHLDLKPPNILVKDSGEIRLLDFGIARTMVREHGAGDEIAALAFSPTYASPEQIQGGPLSVQSDIYSLGVILRKLLSEPVRKPGQTNASAPLPYELEAVVARASALDPDQRYASVSEFQQDLKKYIAKIHDEAVGKLSQLIASYPADSRVIAAKEKLDAKIHADTLNALVATIEQTMDAGDLDCAATMLTDAQMRFPLDQALSPLIARLERAIAKRKEDESTQRSAEIAYKPVAESGDQETHTANDNGLASSEHLRAGALPLRQHASKRSSNRLAQGKQPVAPSTPPQTKARALTKEPASPSLKNKTKRAFHPVQLYTIIGLAASLVLVLLFVGHLIHPGHPPNPSPAEARVVIVSNPSEAAIHVEGNARSVDCVPPPQCPLSLPLGIYSVAATTPNLPPVTQRIKVQSGMGPVEITFPPLPPRTTQNRESEIARSTSPSQSSTAPTTTTVNTPPSQQTQSLDEAARQAREAANSERARQQQEDSELDKIIVEVGVNPSRLSARQKTAFVSNLKTLRCKCGCNDTYLMCFRNHKTCGNRLNNVRHALELATE